jgi:pyruvate dehydrogenase E1 component beta subunit
MARTIRYREALREAMIEEMERDDRVFLMGEEVGHYQGAYKVSEGMLEKFGERRVIDTPIAEGGFAGVGVGAAMVGLRPIVEFMTWNFSAVAFDQILNNATKLRQMSGGQFSCPIVFRGPNASARQVGSQHSTAMEHFYATIPGIKVLAPAFPADAKGLMKAAIRDDNPVCIMESETLYSVKGEVPDGDVIVEMGQANVVRKGTDCTIVAYSRMTHVALEAAATLEKEGISVEVVDLRSLRPLDEDTIADSVRRRDLRPRAAARVRLARGADPAHRAARRRNAVQREARAALHAAGRARRRCGKACGASRKGSILSHGEDPRHAEALADDGGRCPPGVAQERRRPRRGR